MEFSIVRREREKPVHLGSCPSVHFGHQSPVSTSQQSEGWGRAPGGSALCVVSWVSGNTTANSGEADIANSYGEGTSLGVQYEDSKFLVRSLLRELDLHAATLNVDPTFQHAWKKIKGPVGFS